MFFAAKLFIAAFVIAFSSWLAGKRPELAGFIIALPIGSLLALAFTHVEHSDPAAEITLARSILIALPISVMFFLPFFFTEKFGYTFWTAYSLGLALLTAGYFLHRQIMHYFS
jgi:uncharacterized membrane protein YczE